MSPDGSRVLYGEPFRRGVNKFPELWIEDIRTGRRARLLEISSTIEAQWSPHGSAFSVNDHRASDSALCYIYDAVTLGRIDIAQRIYQTDRASERFANAHTYFVVERWEGVKSVLVRLYGHTDYAPVVCFDLGYRVSRAGVVRKLSEHVAPVTDRFCEQK